MTYFPPAPGSNASAGWSTPPTFQSPFGASQPSSGYGFGAPPQQSGGFGYGATPHGLTPAPQAVAAGQKSRKGLFIGLAAAAAVAVGGASVCGYFVLGYDPDGDAINALVSDFTAAVESGDASSINGHLCSSEADAIARVVDIDDTPTPAAQTKSPTSTSDVVVKGEVASASYTVGEQNKGAMYFRKEDGQWKVCMTAAQDFTAAG